MNKNWVKKLTLGLLAPVLVACSGPAADETSSTDDKNLTEETEETIEFENNRMGIEEVKNEEDVKEYIQNIMDNYEEGYEIGIYVDTYKTSVTLSSKDEYRENHYADTLDIRLGNEQLNKWNHVVEELRTASKDLGEQMQQEYSIAMKSPEVESSYILLIQDNEIKSAIEEVSEEKKESYKDADIEAAIDTNVAYDKIMENPVKYNFAVLSFEGLVTDSTGLGNYIVLNEGNSNEELSVNVPDNVFGEIREGDWITFEGRIEILTSDSHNIRVTVTEFIDIQAPR